MNRFRVTQTASYTVVCVLLSAAAAFGQTTYYVDDNGSSATCTGWADACPDLQTALGLAVSGDQIWVASGTYKPTSGTDRTASFQLITGVAVYGGFDGTESTLDERAGLFAQTILSGDIGTLGDDSDNSYHVVTGSGTDATAVLDGFTITGGNANGSSPYDLGGGMYNLAGSPTVTHCTFTRNTAGNGGGIYNVNGASPAVTNCAFTDNRANAAGGGMYNFFADPTVTNCMFSGNFGEWYGGGMHNDNSSPTVTNCTFSNNLITAAGCGMRNNFYSYPTVTNCIFWGHAGCEISDYLSAPTITYSDVHGGYPGTGNIDADPLFVDADGPDDIYGTADDNLRLQAGSPCIDTANNAVVTESTDLDGNIRIWDGNGDATYIVDMGAHEYLTYDCNDNGVPDECDVDCNALSGACNILGCGTSSDCNGNGVPDECETLPTGTLYVDDSVVGGLNDGSTWTNAFVELSRALAFATCTGTVTEIRVAGGTYRPTTGVDQAATFQLNSGMIVGGGYAGSGAAEPDERDFELYETILSGDIGTLGDDSDNSYHVVTGSGTDATAVFDGFTITGGNANGDSPDDCGGGMHNNPGSPTVIHCTFTGNTAGVGAGICNLDGSEPTVNNCVFADNAADFGGGIFNYASAPLFGYCTFTGNSASSWGGGLYSNASSPTVADSSFTGNTADQGGGMSNNNGSAAVTNCTFSENSAGYRGGGMHNNAASSTVTNCNFTGNTAGDGGGGMYNTAGGSTTVTGSVFTGNTAGNGGGILNVNGNPTVINCTFFDNRANAAGGGMYNYLYANPTVTNCTFSGNFGEWYGGGMHNDRSSPTVTNCTFSNNLITAAGCGMRNNFYSYPTVTNCIFWGHAGCEISDYLSTPAITYSDVHGGYPGTGNMDADPLFVDADGPDDIYGTADDSLRLSGTSPCVDRGDNAAVTAPTDLDGFVRISDGDGDGTPTVDMGACELIDCNQNDMLDACDLDCAALGGACDLPGCGLSADGNATGVPDECECYVLSAPQTPLPVMAKSRYLSITPGNPRERAAIRIEFIDVPPPNEDWNGQIFWISPPQEVCENAGVIDPAGAPSAPTFYASSLQCMPAYLDWSTIGTVDIFHQALMPGTLYEVRLIKEVCSVDVEEDYSDPLLVATSRWGDVVKDCQTIPCPPPDGIVGIVDVVAILDKFKNLAGAPLKARADIEPATPDCLIVISDVTRALDAFGAKPYPFLPGVDPCP